MPRTCTICSHKLRLRIDKAIAFGKSNRRIASQFRLTPASVQRHKKHAAAAIERASEKRELSIGERILERLESLYQRGILLLAKAERAKAHGACSAYLRELRHTLQTFYLISREAPQHSAQGKAPPNEELMKAIGRALGVGEFVPRHRKILPKVLPDLPQDELLPEDEVIDLEILPN